MLRNAIDLEVDSKGPITLVFDTGATIFRHHHHNQLWISSLTDSHQNHYGQGGVMLCWWECSGDRQADADDDGVCEYPSQPEISQ